MDLGHIRTSPLVRFRSYLEWATALDDQGYPVLNMPQAEYQKLLDDPRSSFGVTQVFLHDVNQPPFESLQPQRLVFESLAVDQDSLAARYRQILTAAITRWSAENSEPNDVFWINAFVELNLLSREQDTTSRLGQLVKTY